MKIRRLFQGMLIAHTIVAFRQSFIEALDLTYELGMIEGTRTGVCLMLGVDKRLGASSYHGYVPPDLYVYGKIVCDTLDEQKKDATEKLKNLGSKKASRV